MGKKAVHYSVLMSVYQKEKPAFLRRSMQSIYEQTVPTDDFVLVCDGPLNEELNRVIAQMQKKFGDRLRVIRRKTNRGLGAALRLGISECKNSLIARMDSDDISRKDRCEKELAVFSASPELSVVGSLVADFSVSPRELSAGRKVPETHEEILRFAQLRSPMNHPSVMYRKEDVLAAGNYQDVRYCQDYYLWEKMLAKGFKFYNIQEPLVYMHEDKGSFHRRSGMAYFRIQKQLFGQMREDGLLAPSRYYIVLGVRFCSAMAPNWLRRIMFNKFMRAEIKCG